MRICALLYFFCSCTAIQASSILRLSERRRPPAAGRGSSPAAARSWSRPADSARLEVVDRGAGDAVPIERAVLPVALVLDRDRRAAHRGRDVLPAHADAVLDARDHARAPRPCRASWCSRARRPWSSRPARSARASRASAGDRRTTAMAATPKMPPKARGRRSRRRGSPRASCARPAAGARGGACARRRAATRRRRGRAGAARQACRSRQSRRFLGRAHTISVERFGFAAPDRCGAARRAPPTLRPCAAAPFTSPARSLSSSARSSRRPAGPSPSPPPASSTRPIP